RATDIRALGAKAQCLENILTGAYAAVHVDFELVADRVNDRGQGVDGRRGTVKLTPAVVGDDDCVGTGGCCHPRILWVENALDDQLAAPALLDPCHVIPRQLWIELLCRPGGKRREVRDALGVTCDIAEGAALRAQHAHAPRWPCC